MWVTSEEIERSFFQSVMQDASSFHDAADSLLGHLLSTEDGCSPRATDGILFQWQEVKDLRASGSGIVVLIDGQRVEPVRIRLDLDAGESSVATGDVWFGDRHRGGYLFNSKEHHALVNQIWLNREVEFDWKLHFHRDKAGWSAITDDSRKPISCRTPR